MIRAAVNALAGGDLQWLCTHLWQIGLFRRPVLTNVAQECAIREAVHIYCDDNLRVFVLVEERCDRVSRLGQVLEHLVLIGCPVTLRTTEGEPK
jgi:hypothetical protein